MTCNISLGARAVDVTAPSSLTSLRYFYLLAPTQRGTRSLRSDSLLWAFAAVRPRPRSKLSTSGPAPYASAHWYWQWAQKRSPSQPQRGLWGRRQRQGLGKLTAISQRSGEGLCGARPRAARSGSAAWAAHALARGYTGSRKQHAPWACRGPCRGPGGLSCREIVYTCVHMAARP